MKKLTKKIQVLLSISAALFIALAPLIHSYHLAVSSHPHKCVQCSDSISSHGYGTQDCRFDTIKKAALHPTGHHPQGHDSETCPLCQQLVKLLKSQFVFSAAVLIVQFESLTEKRFATSDEPVSTAYINIIPRAPPAC